MEACAIAYGWSPSEMERMTLGDLDDWAGRAERWIKVRVEMHGRF